MRSLGHDFMDRLNRGMIDPTSLRALAGLKGKGASRVAARPVAGAQSFYSGGQVSPAKGGGGGVSRAYIVPDGQTLDRQLSSGRGAMMRFMSDHKDEINSSLGGGRGLS